MSKNRIRKWPLLLGALLVIVAIWLAPPYLRSSYYGKDLSPDGKFVIRERTNGDGIDGLYLDEPGVHLLFPWNASIVMLKKGHFVDWRWNSNTEIDILLTHDAVTVPDCNRFKGSLRVVEKNQ